MATRPNNTTGIHLQGGDTSKHGEGVSLVAASIASLIQVAYDTHTDQDTLRIALKVLRDMVPVDASVTGTTISGVTVKMEQPE